MATTTFQVKATIELPEPPNFFRMSDGQIFPIEGATEESLREVGRLWTERLVEKARERSQRPMRAGLGLGET